MPALEPVALRRGEAARSDGLPRRSVAEVEAEDTLQGRVIARARYRGAGPEPWDPGRSWRHLAFLVGHWQLGGAGAWALELRRTGAFVGYVGFSAPAGWSGFELAWALARGHWGNGYATEGARAALAWAFADPRRDRVIRLIHPENRASLLVAERIGETLEERVEHFGREMLWYGVDRAGCGGRVDGERRWVPEVWVAP